MRYTREYKWVLAAFWAGCALAFFSMLATNLQFNGFTLLGIVIAGAAYIVIVITEAYTARQEDSDHDPRCIKPAHAGHGCELEQYCDCRVLALIDKHRHES